MTGTCDICKEHGKYVYQFPAVPHDLEIEGNMAHVGCVLNARRAHQKKQSKLGIRPEPFRPSLSCD